MSDDALVHSPGGRDPATRGRTTIADRVLTQLATRIALDVPGVVQHSPGPDLLSAISKSVPSATVEQAGERVRLEMEVAVDWGAEVRKVAAQVRDDVRTRLADVTGKSVDRVDVRVTQLVAADPAAGGRRVQ